MEEQRKRALQQRLAELRRAYQLAESDVQKRAIQQEIDKVMRTLLE